MQKGITSRIIFLLFPFAFLIFTSCSLNKQISKSAERLVIKDSALLNAHVGISIYDPATGKYLYNYQGDKYFVPASNTKLPTCYAAMKYLGDSLVGLRYGIPEGTSKLVAVKPSGDPTFLQEDFSNQPVFDFLKQKLDKEKMDCNFFIDTLKGIEGLGSGWAWNDYLEDYMAERSDFPVYGNLIHLQLNKPAKRTYIDTFLTSGKEKRGDIFITQNLYFTELLNKANGHISIDNIKEGKLLVERDFSSNTFWIKNDTRRFKEAYIPFVPGLPTTTEIFKSLFDREIGVVVPLRETNKYDWDCSSCDINQFYIKNWIPIHSQPTDSLLKITMHRSDNFFAEQTLLMVSNEKLGFMNDEKIIDTLLKTDFKDLPQKPRWVDGSGLSRYNLFTPQDFVAILNKIKNEFGMERIKNILPTGNTGTLSNYYKAENGYIFAKTGTLSGVVALSGYLYTKNNRLLIFSILVNNHQASAANVRRAVERFVETLR